MAGYDIGMSGISAAQKALNVIGNNLANAATPGYHRQQVDLRPARGFLYERRDDRTGGGFCRYPAQNG